MKTANRLLLLCVVTGMSGNVVAAESGGRPAVDTSKWQCKLCKFEDGVSGTAEVGVGHVSDDSFKFGEYTGLHEDGGFFIGDGSLHMRGPGAGYLDVDVSNLGLSSRSVDIEGGQQGKYKVLLNYDEVPHYLSDSARTPFIGSGGASLTLPAGYPAATTGVMPLAGTLQPVDIESKRKRAGIGASLNAGAEWQYGVEFRRETRDGTKRSAGSFFINSAQLVAPVDYETDQIDAFATYTGAQLQAKFAYHGSRFRNANDALGWQNPFDSLGFPGSVAGQLALAPDNQFNQLSASVGYRFTDRTRASADIAFGRMTQDENFLAPTLNATLAVPAPPRTNLDARADTLNSNVKLTSELTERLRLSAAYTRDERDNRTPQAVYQWVTTDMFLATPRLNRPYSFKRDRVKLNADYRFTPAVRGAAGFDYDWHERTFQSVDETREGTLWGRVSARALENVDLSFKLARAERDHSGHEILPWVDPPANPLMRKYNVADRTRDSANLRADIAATDTVSIGLGVDVSNDDYRDSTIGLTRAKDYAFNGDLSAMLSGATRLYLFAAYQVIESEQAGSQTFARPDWWAENKDTIKLFGIGVKHTLIQDKLDVGADYTLTRTRSAISVNAGTLDPAFPDLSTSRDSFKLYATYRLKDNVSLNAGYWYEHYDSKSWALDGLAPGTIPNVLTFGEQPPRYNVHLVRLSVKYRF